jgi:hypothetical protein
MMLAIVQEGIRRNGLFHLDGKGAGKIFVLARSDFFFWRDVWWIERDIYSMIIFQEELAGLLAFRCTRT